MSAGCSREHPAVLVLYGGQVYTGEGKKPFAEAVAISGGRIIAIGTSNQVLTLAGTATTIQLQGRLVLPGWNDAHAHFLIEPDGVTFLTSHSPTPDPNPLIVLDSVRALAARTPPGEWIQTSIGEAALASSALRRDALDAAAPRHPVSLTAWTGHGAIFNSLALKALSVRDDEPDPMGGFQERGGGRLSGLVHEYALYRLAPRFARLRPDSAQIEDFLDYAAGLARFGITTIQLMGLDPDQTVSLLRRASAASRTGRLPVDVHVIRFPMTTASGRSGEWMRPVKGPLPEGVTIAGTKYILDGTPIERGALLRRPYADRPGWYGRLNFPPDTIRKILQETLATGDQAIFHAVGDSTISLLLSLMRSLAADSTWQRLRVRIEHGDGVAADLIAPIKRLGIVVVQNPTHLALGELAAARYGSTRLKEFQPLKSLVEAGIPVAFGSDGALDPLLNIMLASVHPDNPDEALTRAAAIAAYTHGSAFAERAERIKGSIAVGQVANLVVLTQNLFTVPMARLQNAKVAYTIVSGKVVYDMETTPGR